MVIPFQSIITLYVILFSHCGFGCYHYFDCLADPKDPTYLLTAKPACFVTTANPDKSCVIPNQNKCAKDSLTEAQAICDQYSSTCLGVAHQGGKYEPKLATGSTIGPLPDSLEFWMKCDRKGMWQSTPRVTGGVSCTSAMLNDGQCVQKKNLKSEDDCKTSCEQDSTAGPKNSLCNMYEWNSSDKSCTHFRGANLDNLVVESDLKKQVSVRLGYKDCLQSKVQYSGTILSTLKQIKIGTRKSPFPPNASYDVNLSVADPNLCSRACRMTTGCKYFNWSLSGSTSTCQLLKDIKQYSSKSASTFGPLESLCSTALVGETGCPYISVVISGTDSDKIVDESDVFSAQMKTSADFKAGNYDLKNGKLWYMSSSGNAFHYASNSWMISTPAGVYLSNVGTVSAGGDAFIDTRVEAQTPQRVIISKCLLSEKGDVPTAPFAKDDRIQWKDTIVGSAQLGNWLPGRIQKKNTDGTYLLLLDDGAEYPNAKETNIRGMSETDESRTKFQLEELVEGRRSDTGAWDQGQVKILQKNGLYTVVYDSDGFVDTYMTPARLRQFSIYKLKEKVEVIQYFWFPCTVESINPDGSYLIIFDDIQKKQNKDFEDIRPKKVEYSTGSVVMATFKSGAKVMAVVIAKDPQQAPDQLNRYQIGLLQNPADLKNVDESGCSTPRAQISWTSITNWDSAPNGCYCPSANICYTTTKYLSQAQQNLT